MAKPGGLPRATIVQRPAKLCPIPCHDLRLTFQSGLEYFQGDLARYSFGEYLDAENSLDTIFRQGYGAPKAASFLAPGCGRKKPATELSGLEHAFCRRQFRF